MNVLNFLKKNSQIILIIIVILLGGLLFRSNSNMKNERKEWERKELINNQNISVITDSLTKNYDSTLQAYKFEKDIYVVDKLKDLKQYNKELANEVKNLEKKNTNLMAMLNAATVVKIPPVTIGNDLVEYELDGENKKYGLRFTSVYKDNGYQQTVSGISKFQISEGTIFKIIADSTILDTITSRLLITYGFKEFDGKYKVFAVSESPLVNFVDLTGGYFIDKQILPIIKPKKWSIGPYVGYGVITFDKNLKLGWSVGIGIHYNILSW